MRSAATKSELGQKADARHVEQAIMLLALQFDQATQLSSEDFERLRVCIKDTNE